jgi:hypothetical protein
MIGKINFLTVLSALVLFWLPWMELRCDGRLLATQTGFQSIQGTASPASEVTVNGDNPFQEPGKASSFPKATLIGGAFFSLVVALLLALRGILSKRPQHLQAGLLAGVALTLILAQWAAGFPIENHARESATISPPGYRTLDPSAGQRSELAILSLDVKADPTTAFYLVIFLLAVPSLIGGYSILGLIRNRLAPS